MGERTKGFWKRRAGGPTGKVALVEPAALTPSPVLAVERGDVERPSARRLKLLAGLLSRGRGDSIDP